LEGRRFPGKTQFDDLLCEDDKHSLNFHCSLGQQVKVISPEKMCELLSATVKFKIKSDTKALMLPSQGGVLSSPVSDANPERRNLRAPLFSTIAQKDVTIGGDALHLKIHVTPT